MVIQSKLICKLFGVRGICLWPFVIVNDKKNKVLVNHELIHMAQAKELCVIKFYWLYFKYYFENRKKFKGYKTFKHYWSYRNIAFEKEAFENQKNLNYIKTRSKNAWKKYK